jgi:hypothetical protein
MAWLAHCPRKWLLVFDGTDHYDHHVEDFFPPGSNGSILITTRSPTLCRLSYPADANRRVSELQEDSAMALLFHSAKVQFDILEVSIVDRARQTINALCRFPLAIELAGSFIANGPWRIDDYLTIYENHYQKLLIASDLEDPAQPETVAYVVWDITMEELERRCGSPQYNVLSYKIAQFLLFIHSSFHFNALHENMFLRAAEAIPFETAIERDFASFHPSSSLQSLVRKVQGKRPSYGVRQPLPSEIEMLQELCLYSSFPLHEGASLLVKFSLIQPSASGASYIMHQMFHQWCRERMSTKLRSIYWEAAVDILTRSLNNCATVDDAYHIAIYPHVRHLMKHQSGGDYLLQEARVLFDVFQTLQDFDSAESLLRNVIVKYTGRLRYDSTIPTFIH